MSETMLNHDAWSTNQVDPWTESGYSDWVRSAYGVRCEWMEMMGFSPSEIDEECAIRPPTDFDEELAEYNAMFAIQQRNG